MGGIARQGAAGDVQHAQTENAAARGRGILSHGARDQRQRSRVVNGTTLLVLDAAGPVATGEREAVEGDGRAGGDGEVAVRSHPAVDGDPSGEVARVDGQVLVQHDLLAGRQREGLSGELRSKADGAPGQEIADGFPERPIGTGRRIGLIGGGGDDEGFRRVIKLQFVDARAAADARAGHDEADAGGGDLGEVEAVTTAGGREQRAAHRLIVQRADRGPGCVRGRSAGVRDRGVLESVNAEGPVGEPAVVVAAERNA